MANIRTDVDRDGVGLIVWDMPGRTMNVLHGGSISEFAVAVERAIADPAVKGVVVTSAKPAFIAGADLPWMASLTADVAGEPPKARAARLFGELIKLQLLLRKIETCGKPFAAALNGTALGGGFEVALACHFRVATNDPRAQLGLPEAKVGLLPGGGGLTRYVRMLGAAKALPLLLEGTALAPATALELGLVDEIAADVVAAAKVRVLSAIPESLVKPWDRKGFTPPGPDPRLARDARQWSAAITLLHRKTHGNYPALQAIADAVYDGWLVPIDTALRIETRYLVKLLLGANARAMIRTNFISMQKANKLARRPASVAARTLRKIGVLGAGLMGAGIAHVAAQAGFEVVLIDRDQASADRGRAHTLELETRARPDAAHEITGRITATADCGALAGADLVIEAVFEDRAVKAEATRRASAVLGPDAIFASNTSTLPITGLAEAFEPRARFVGLHFFSPVEKMRLVEIILGRETGDDALAAAMDFARAIRKTPIVVNDSRGFYTSRVFATYTQEGLRMLAEGVKPALIENAGRAIGMPMPPLALCDEVAIDLIHRVAAASRRDLGDAYEEPPFAYLIETMVGLGRFGKKARKGFYDYSAAGEKHLWPGLADLAPRSGDPPDFEQLKTRMLAIQCLEAARCLEENVVTDPADADVGALLGWGFAPWTGGPLSHIDTLGAAAFVVLCGSLAQRHGPRFAPSSLLRRMAAEGRGFYDTTDHAA